MKFQLSVLIIALFTALPSAFAAGPDVTGGGDVIVMKFKSAGRDFCDHLKNSKPANNLPFTVQNLCAAVNQVKVSVDDRVFLPDGTEVDALNFPQKGEIKLSLRRNETKFNSGFLYLAIHEYISVIGVDDKNYNVSAPLILQMELSEANSDIPAQFCPNVKAEYACEEDPNPWVPSSYKIEISNNMITSPMIIPPHLPQRPWEADGIEHQVTYEPPTPPTYVDAHEEYAKATCLADGFKLETRNTDFGCTGQETPNYKCKLAGRTWAYKKFGLNSDASILMYYEKSVFTSVTGKVTTRESKKICTRK